MGGTELPRPAPRREHRQVLQGLPFHFEIGFDVSVGGRDIFVTKPDGYHFQSDARLEQVHSRRMTPSMERYLAPAKRWTACCRFSEA